MNRKHPETAKECTDIVVFLSGNEYVAPCAVQPSQPDADEGLGEKFPGRECTDIVLVLTEEDSLPSPPQQDESTDDSK